MNPRELVALFDAPAEAARLAAAARAEAFVDTVEIRGAPAIETVCGPDDFVAWKALRPGVHLVVRTEPTEAGRLDYAQWLVRGAPHVPAGGLWLCPTSLEPAGLHRLWSIAAARIVLPATVRVVARHDLIGIRLAQLALGMGADTLAGPIDTDRRLPVAGIPRPNENTPTGLATLVRQAGLRPEDMIR